MTKSSTARAHRPDGVRPAGHTPLGDPPERLTHHAATHLARPQLPLDEGDRDLDDAKAAADRPPGQVDLEAVPLRLDTVEPETHQGLPTERAVTAGYVPERHAQGEPGV